MWSTLFLLPLLPFVVGEQLEITRHPSTDCFYSCAGALTTLSFSDAPADITGYYAKMAASNYFLTSLVSCIEHYCSSPKTFRGALQGWELYIGYAMEYGPDVVLPTFNSVKEGMSGVQVTDYDVMNANLTVLVNGTVIPDTESYDIWFRTLDTWSMEMYYHHVFGYALYFLLGLMVLVGLAGRAFNWITYRVPDGEDAQSFRSEVAPSTSVTARLWTGYRKYVETPALLGRRHAEPAYQYFSIPTRLQAFFIFLYVALNVIFCSVGYSAFEENQYWPGVINTQVWRYVSDRTGIICFYNLPLLWLFAGRNDFLMWITGWSFSSFNLMHRWVARIATIQAIIHSIGYTWLEKGYIASEWSELYWRAGVFATVFMALLLPLSMLPLRKYWYEIFLILHILIAAVLLPLLWYHVDIMDGTYAPFLWACVAIWVFDRLARIVRLQVLSWNAFKGQNAVATLTGNEHGLIRLSVNTPFKINPKPGQYFFLYHPRSLTPWENHPFTLASWEQEEKSTKLNFLIAVQSGATKRLRRRLQEDQPTSMRVLLEGPYGHTEPVERYEHVLFVAGGSGVTAVLPYIHQLKSKHFTRSVTLVWSVKNNAYASDVLSKELRDCGAEVFIHVTEEEQPAVATLKQGEQPLVDATSRTGEEDKEKTTRPTSDASANTIVIGRPEMKDLIRVATKRLVGSERLAVVACGPAGMMDDLRKAVTEVYGNEEGQVNGSAVDYYEELFSW